MRSTTALPPPSDGARGSRPPGRGTQPPGRGVVYRGPGEPTRTAPHHHRDRLGPGDPDRRARPQPADGAAEDRKSTRLNSSHVAISYAVFCLKKKNTYQTHQKTQSTTMR